MENKGIYQEASQGLEQLCEDLVAEIGESFTPREKDFLKGLLLGDKPEQIAKKYNVESNTVRTCLSKTVYPRISQFLERRSGKEVKISHWSQVASLLTKAGYGCQSASSPLTEGVYGWEGVPEVSTFYGRINESTILKQWVVQERCRLITVYGARGIGKTTLVAKLVQNIQSHFSYVIWRYLRNAPEIEVLLAEVTQKLADQLPVEPAKADTPKSLDAQISGLIRYLRSHRCLVVLDDLDELLNEGTPTGQMKAEYRGYENLIRRLGEESHQSCVMLVSWVKPGRVELMEGSEQPVRSLGLKGLENEAARALLSAKNLPQQVYWDDLIHIYRGNPYALKVVAAYIQDIRGGNVKSFLDANTIYLGRLKNLLHEQFTYLSEPEKEILAWFASVEQPVSLSQLYEALKTIGSKSIIDALIKSLDERSLIEKLVISAQDGEKEVVFNPTPIILKYVTSEYQSNQHLPPNP